MTPTFKMHGSKARTAPWIVERFPTGIGRYLDPFAGRGNVWFRLAACQRVGAAVLGDLNTAPFLRALRDYRGDYGFVDGEPLDRSTWERWRDAPPSHERALAESYVARFGGAYRSGPATAGNGSANRHSRENTIARMRAARALLQGVAVVETSWPDTLAAYPYRSGDLLYLDPPYDVPQSVHYGNVDHDALLDAARRWPGPVYVSGYSTPRYEAALHGWHRAERERASTGKGGRRNEPKPRAVEVLWWRV